MKFQLIVLILYLSIFSAFKNPFLLSMDEKKKKMNFFSLYFFPTFLQMTWPGRSRMQNWDAISATESDCRTKIKSFFEKRGFRYIDLTYETRMGPSAFGKKLLKWRIFQDFCHKNLTAFFVHIIFSHPVGAPKLHKLCLISSKYCFSVSDLLGSWCIKISVLRPKVFSDTRHTTWKKRFFEFLLNLFPNFNRIF